MKGKRGRPKKDPRKALEELLGKPRPNKDYRRQLVRKIRKEYEKPDSATYVLPKEEFYSPDRARLLEGLGLKVRAARAGGPPPGWYPVSPQDKLDFVKRTTVRVAEMEEMQGISNREAEEWYAGYRAKRIAEWIERVDEVMRIRRERRAKAPLARKISFK